MPSDTAHWERLYGETSAREASWYEAVPERSLSLIASAQLPRDAAILDVGGGNSKLAAHLLDLGYRDITVTDISSAALDQARSQLGSRAAAVAWITADLRTHAFARRYDLWHDRAVFHFMVEAADGERYLKVLRETLRPGGHLVLATFGPGGPKQCSGLPVRRYAAADLSQSLGAEFVELWSGLDVHRTPSGAHQQFLYSHFRYL